MAASTVRNDAKPSNPCVIPRMTPIVRSGPSWAWVKSASTAATVGMVVSMPLIVAPNMGPTVVTKTTIAAPANILVGRSDLAVARLGIGGAAGSSRRETNRIAIVVRKAGPSPQEDTSSIAAQVTTNAPYAAAPANGQSTRRQTRA